MAKRSKKPEKSFNRIKEVLEAQGKPQTWLAEQLDLDFQPNLAQASACAFECSQFNFCRKIGRPARNMVGRNPQVGGAS